MLNIFETGEASFRLSNSRDENVGWIRGAALGFDGFGTEEAAIAAAVAGSDALTAYVDRIVGSSNARESKGGRLKVTHDGAYEWVTRGATPLARLYRPERDHTQRDRRRTFAVEFVVPSYVKAGALISASQVVHHAIGRAMEAATASLTPDGAPAGRATSADRAVV